MVIVNVLADTIPINGQGTSQVSDSYKNLFAPAGLTFAIWGLIYVLLAGYTAYQLGFFNLNKRGYKADLFEKVGLYFSISSIANATWIFSWHYHLIALFMIIAVGLAIGIVTMLRNRDIAYGLVIIWAYAGIFIKHTSASGFAGQYPVMITTVMVCIVLLLIGEVYIIISNRKT